MGASVEAAITRIGATRGQPAAFADVRLWLVALSCVRLPQVAYGCVKTSAKGMGEDEKE